MSLNRSFFFGPRKAALLSTLLAGSILSGGMAWADSGPLQLPPLANQAGFSELVTKVRPAVVNIATAELRQQAKAPDLPDLSPGQQIPPMFRHFFDQPHTTPDHALGSGFIIDPAGYIVTNNHVVDGAKKITVTLDDGSAHPAKVVGRDAKTDLALLKIDSDKPLPYVAFGESSKEHVGDWVVAVGDPFGLGGTVTAGIVSAHGRNINEGPYDDFLQIDAPINPGNSGGPLFNQSGQVIGIDTAIYSPNGGSVGIGFAIPSDLAAQVIGQLRAHGKVDRGWLGVQMQPMTPALAKAVGLAAERGVLVNEVLADSPAAKARLQQGDVILAFQGTLLASPRDLAMAVATAHSGDNARLTVWRDGHERTVEITIGAQPAAQAEAKLEEKQGGALGMALAPLTGEAKGVVVAHVTEGSAADDSGVKPGDVIVRIGEATVTTPKDAALRIREAENAKREALPLLVTRNGTTYYIALQLSQG